MEVTEDGQKENRKAGQRLNDPTGFTHGPSVLLLRLGVSQQEYADAIQGCIQHANPYRSKILDNLGIPQKPPRKMTEKETWEALGLEDLWGPATDHEPDENDPLSLNKSNTFTT